MIWIGIIYYMSCEYFGGAQINQCLYEFAQKMIMKTINAQGELNYTIDKHNESLSPDEVQEALQFKEKVAKEVFRPLIDDDRAVKPCRSCTFYKPSEPSMRNEGS